ncbi:MAG: M15 family metallopeptidase [Pseudomonadota bacterium]
MPYRWSARSLERLHTCHPDLIRLFEAAIKDRRLKLDLTVLQGHRTVEEQSRNVQTGASNTMRSRHLLSPSMAVDVAPYVDGAVSWHWPHYYMVAPVIEKIAKEMRIDVEWGGHWTRLRDGPHWQLPDPIPEQEWKALGL